MSDENLEQPKPEAERTTSDPADRKRCETLLESFADGDDRALADALREDVADDLDAKLTPELPAPVFQDTTATVQRLRAAITSQSGAVRSASVEEVPIEEGTWEQHQLCGDQPASSRWEVTIYCEAGTHQLGLGIDDGDVVEIAFLDQYSLPASVDEEKFTESEITFETDGVEIGGTLTVPTETEPTGCVIFVHGAGSADRNYELGAQQFLKDVAWYLAEQGIASYRYDKRSYITELDPSNFGIDWPVIDDAIAATETIAAHPDIDENRLFLAGHSRGGMFAPRIADRYGEYRGVIVLEGYAQSFPEYLVDALTAQKQLERTADGEREAIAERLSVLEDVVESGDVSELAEVVGIPENYLEDVVEYEKMGVAGSLDTPFLVLQGGGDIPAFKQASVDLWRETLTHPASTVVYSESHNHYLQRCHTPSVGVESHLFHDNVDPDVIAHVPDWVSDVTS